MSDLGSIVMLILFSKINLDLIDLIDLYWLLRSIPDLISVVSTVYAVIAVKVFKDDCLMYS